MWASPGKEAVTAALARAFLAGDWSRDGLLERGRAAIGRKPKWLETVVTEALVAYRDRPADRRRELGAFIAQILEQVDERNRLPRRAPTVRKDFDFTPEMGRARWPVPDIRTLVELGDYLGVGAPDLGWLADPRALERIVVDQKLANYHYAWLPRPSGTPRLIEAPKPWLKKLQRRVLHRILGAIPPHEAAHGFRAGHSALTHARRHSGQAVVMGFDLEDFFAAISAGRVFGIFRTAGYPEEVAHTLTALCTNSAPAGVLRTAPTARAAIVNGSAYRLRQALATPHLPQGAPTSPALANLSAYRLDCRLSGLAESFGAVYSRYADDITVSGARSLVARAQVVRRLVGQIVSEEGFSLNSDKTHLTTAAGRQQVTGVVVNDGPNIARADFDLLKAQLHSAATHGPAAANRTGIDDFRAHLMGRVAWVEHVNPQRGAKLRRVFERIAWGDEPIGAA